MTLAQVTPSCQCWTVFDASGNLCASKMRQIRTPYNAKKDPLQAEAQRGSEVAKRQGGLGLRGLGSATSDGTNDGLEHRSDSFSNGGDDAGNNLEHDDSLKTLRVERASVPAHDTDTTEFPAETVTPKKPSTPTGVAEPAPTCKKGAAPGRIFNPGPHQLL